MAYCNHCGIKVVDGAKFCQKCGEAINGETYKHEGQRQQEYVGKKYKCPNCGESLKSFEANCPACGYELRGSRATNSIRELSLKLELIENRREHKPTNSRRSKFDYNSILNPEISKTDEQKATLIRTFPIPNTKEDLFEFIILAQSNVDSDLYANDIRNSARIVSDAWKSKFEQAYHKAEVLFTNDPEFQHIQTLNQKMSTKIKKSKSKQLWQLPYVIG